METRSSSELSGLDLPLRRDRDVNNLVQELHLWNLFCCATGIHHFVAELKLGHLDCLIAHLDCGTCFCIITEWSTTLSMNCGWASRLCSAPAGPATLNRRNFQRFLYHLVGQRLALLHNWDINDRVNVLDQWDVHYHLYPLNHKHLSLHHHRNVCSDLSEILLDRGKDLLLLS